jgi:N-methylhydantoinase B/oxoprolinase/acetone carboxylase alpha subunit
LPGKQTCVIPAGEAIVLELPGDGGYGKPEK